jgi:hypothetical protein
MCLRTTPSSSGALHWTLAPSPSFAFCCHDFDDQTWIILGITAIGWISLSIFIVLSFVHAQVWVPTTTTGVHLLLPVLALVCPILLLLVSPPSLFYTSSHDAFAAAHSATAKTDVLLSPSYMMLLSLLLRR